MSDVDGRDVGNGAGAVLMFDLDLGPMARRTGVEYVYDTVLDGVELDVGERIRACEGSGRPWDAEVNTREAIPPGRRYQLRLRPAGESGDRT